MVVTKKPALAVLGISPGFVRTHPETVVVTVADAIYRAAATRYHPDRADSVPLPEGVTLTDLQDARDAVRKTPKASIRELVGNERISREEKEIVNLQSQLSNVTEGLEGNLEVAAMLWEHIARQKLGMQQEYHMRKEGEAPTFSVINLNGFALLVHDESKRAYVEYLCREGTWWKRPLVRSRFTKNIPCPPCLPPELVNTSVASSGDHGAYYDQSGPHEELKDFEILGSYVRAELGDLRRKQTVSRKKDAAAEPESLTAPTDVDPVEGQLPYPKLDPLVVAVLKPLVGIGRVLQAVNKGERGVEYRVLGTIAGTRVFDQKQRAQ